MESYEFDRYPYVDASWSASPGVSGIRGASPIGSLIHCTDGANSEAWLRGDSATAGRPASTNYLIARSGAATKLCPDYRYPYHAGASRCYLNGKWEYGDQVSELLVGYELECLWTEVPTYEQVDSLAALIVASAVQYGWRWPFILYGHNGVAIPAGRRSDPWLFDWGMLMGRLYVRAHASGIGGVALVQATF